MHQDKPVQPARCVDRGDKDNSAKRKANKRKKEFKTNSWYERAASSIKAAPAVRRR